MTRLLLVIAPSLYECHHTVRAFGLDLARVGQMRFISKPYGLRSWSRGTPFIAQDRGRWPVDLDETLQALIVLGRLRIANEFDLAELLEDIDPPAPHGSLYGSVSL